jgi:ParB/RepB/Spo0J family partition protein
MTPPLVQLVLLHALTSDDPTRGVRSEERIQQLEEDFRRRQKENPDEHPVHTPARVVRRGDKFLLVTGNYRYFAALRIPLKDMPCIVLPDGLDDVALFIEATRDNVMRENYSPVDLARNILFVMEKRGCTQAEAGRLLGIKPCDVTKHLRVFKGIPEDVLNMIGVGDGKLPFSCAYLLTKLAEEQRVRDLAEKCARGLLCREGLEIEIRNLLGSNNRQQKEKPYTLSSGGVAVSVSGGDILESLKAFVMKLGDAIKKLEKDGSGPEYLGALIH